MISPAGLTVGLILIAVGAILAFAVEDNAEGVDVTTVGWILIIVGAIAALLSLMTWMGAWGPERRGYRRRAVVDEPPVVRRREVIEDDVGGPPPP
jgi:cation transporter-like permease